VGWRRRRCTSARTGSWGVRGAEAGPGPCPAGVRAYLLGDHVTLVPYTTPTEHLVPYTTQPNIWRRIRHQCHSSAAPPLPVAPTSHGWLVHTLVPGGSSTSSPAAIRAHERISSWKSSGLSA